MIMKDHSDYCGSYPCDGGNDCWINCQPTEKQCKKCLCSSCILGTCTGGKPTREKLREIDRKDMEQFIQENVANIKFILMTVDGRVEFCTMPQIDLKVDKWFGRNEVHSKTLSENPLIIASQGYGGWVPGFYVPIGWSRQSGLFTEVNWPTMSWKRALLTRLHPERFLQRNTGIPGSIVDELIWTAREERNIRTFAVVAALEKTITY